VGNGLLVGGGDQRLASNQEALYQALAPLRVQLAHHVIEEEEWGEAVSGEERLALGEEQGQQAGPLLAL
jgi:hypothetical protein